MNDVYRGALVSGFTKKQDILWVFEQRFNILFEYDLSRDRIRLLYDFKQHNGVSLYNQVVRVENKLVLIPCFAKNIAVYDLETEEMRLIPESNNRKKCGIFNNDHFMFLHYYVFGRKILLFGLEYPAVLLLDTDTYTVSYIDGWIDELHKNSLRADSKLIRQGAVHADGRILLPLDCLDALLEINLRDMRVRIVYLTNGSAGYSGIVRTGNEIWLLSSCERIIYVMDMELHYKKAIAFEKADGTSAHDEILFELYAYEDKVLVIPIYGSSVYEIDRNSNEIMIPEEFRKVLYSQGFAFSRMKTIRTNQYENKLCFFTGHDAKFHEYDLKNRVMQSRCVYLPEEMTDKYYALLLEEYDKKTVLYENVVPVEKFMAHIRQRNAVQADQAGDESIGARILRNI